MPYPYPAPDDESLTETEARFLCAKVTPYREADEGDRIFALIGSIESASYSARGGLVLKLEIPYDIVGNPTELMHSQGRMIMVEGYKL